MQKLAKALQEEKHESFQNIAAKVMNQVSNDLATERITEQCDNYDSLTVGPLYLLTKRHSLLTLLHVVLLWILLDL